ARGYIYGDVGAKSRQMAQEYLGFEAGARSELHEDRAFRDALCHLSGIGLENRSLRPRWIVFRQPGDRLEEFTASRVVEEPARQGFLSLREPLDHGSCEIVICRAGRLRPPRFGYMHYVH